MKKIVILLTLIALVTLSLTTFIRTAYAACSQMSPGVHCNLTSCTVSGVGYCCSSPSECSALTGNGSASAGDPTAGCGSTKINTAIGCIPVLTDDNGTGFAGFILKWAVGIGSGVAFIFILYAGFMIMTSQGNPDRLKAGQELLTSAISGLVLIILSIFILKFIGIDILGLGTFGFGSH